MRFSSSTPQASSLTFSSHNTLQPDEPYFPDLRVSVKSADRFRRVIESLNRAATGVSNMRFHRSRQAFRAKPPDVLDRRSETARVASLEKRGFLNILSLRTRW